MKASELAHLIINLIKRYGDCEIEVAGSSNEILDLVWSQYYSADKDLVSFACIIWEVKDESK